MKTIQTNTKKFRLICRTDLYHASLINGFDKSTGIKVIDTFDTLKEANDALFKGLKEDAEQYFSFWEAGIDTPNIRGFFIAGTLPDGTRFYNVDVYCYSIHEFEEA